MTLALVFLFTIGFAFFLVWWAHEAERDRSAMVGLYLMLGAPGFLLLVAGLAVTTRNGTGGIGPTLLLTGIGLLLPCFPRARSIFATIGDFDPRDPVHVLGSGIFLGALGFLGAQLISSPDPGEVTSFDVGALILQAIFFVGLAVVAVGYRIDRTLPQVLERLGLVKPTLSGFYAAIGAVLLAFVVSIVASILTRATNQTYADEINQSLDVLTTSRPSYIAAPVIGLSAGIGEELLFRGAIQPRYGIIGASLLFALLHNQYGLSVVTLGTFLLGCILGALAKRYGTTHAIIAHTLYNTLAVLLASLAD